MGLFKKKSENEETVKIDKKELWEQMKKDAVGSCYSVTFEVIDVDKDTHQIACFVDEHVPVVSSNFQHAGLISGIINYLKKYVESIETKEEFEERFVVIGAFLEELASLSLAIGKLMDKNSKYLKKKDESEEEEIDE